MLNPQLAALDPEDVASAAHPYLQLAVLPALQQAAARRLRTASFTPGGLPQPPEVMGVDGDARVPNPLQPMSGEFEGGAEVDAGRPGYFGALMPEPTGVANPPAGIAATGADHFAALWNLDRRAALPPAGLPAGRRASQRRQK